MHCLLVLFNRTHAYQCAQDGSRTHAPGDAREGDVGDQQGDMGLGEANSVDVKRTRAETVVLVRCVSMLQFLGCSLKTLT